jgi:aldehyde dehydrogenase (NAD+)
MKIKGDGLGPFIAQCGLFSTKISCNRQKLVNLLSKYETYETACDEIERSIQALQGMDEELKNLQKPLSGLVTSTFFPLNLPLYSLVLFGIVPSAFSANVFIRPPEIMQKILEELFELLDMSEYFPAISLYSLPRHIFTELYASESDAIIFTGKYENALKIREHCPQALLLYNGSGVNPFIILEDAHVDLAVRKSVEMRCFNSGQDCAGPDAFLVPSNLVDEYLAKLKAALNQVKVGRSTNPSVRVSRTMKDTYIKQVEDFFEHEQDHNIYGGKIDKVRKYVHPTIFHKLAIHHKDDFHEFFAPVFYVLEYRHLGELETIINAAKFKERAMYVSIFGHNPKIEEKLDFVKVLKNKIVNDIESGNNEYGGYGPHANFLLYGEKQITKPILISRDIHSLLVA